MQSSAAIFGQERTLVSCDMIAFRRLFLFVEHNFTF